MPPKAQKEIVFPITSEEQFLGIIVPENKKLTVIDVHLNWCGPCTVMGSNYRTIYFSYEEADKRIEFWTCENTFLPEDVAAPLTITCKPTFLVYVEGEQKAVIVGADYT